MKTENKATQYDIEGALARFAGDEELLGEAIKIFHTEAPRHLETIKGHLADGSMEIIVGESHTLKGECGAVGAMAAYRLCDLLEKAAKEDRRANCIEMFDQVEETVRAAMTDLSVKIAG